MINLIINSALFFLVLFFLLPVMMIIVMMIIVMLMRELIYQSRKRSRCESTRLSQRLHFLRGWGKEKVAPEIRK
jgi:hypothetical protein